MMNFDELPTERPDGTFKDGVYQATVKDSQIKTAKTDGNAYLAVTLTCIDPATKNTALVYDNFYTTDKPLNKYKLRRFLEATGCILKGDFDLKDLPKIIGNKKLNVALKTEKNSGYAPRNIVDVFEDGIYYPVTDPTSPFNATDALPDDTSEDGVEY